MLDLENGITVLSLFDGMSCGMIALQRAGIKVKAYYASEIDKPAMKVAKHNWPEIIHIGDVTKVFYAEGWLFTENGEFYVGKIDLLIGGSPCQGFSFAGKQLNFKDLRSKLFFEYVRLREETECEYFFLENVVMKQEFQDVISSYLKVNPVFINSALVSAHDRKRLYWSNINFIDLPKDKGIKLIDIADLLDSTFSDIKTQQRPRSLRNFRTLNEKSFCMTATMYKGSQSNGMTNIDVGYGLRCLNRKECEKLQTVPVGYTNSVSLTQAYKMLGNGWTVDVIAHLFEPLKYVI